MVDTFSNVGCELFMQVLVLYGLSFKTDQSLHNLLLYQCELVVTVSHANSRTSTWVAASLQCVWLAYCSLGSRST